MHRGLFRLVMRVLVTALACSSLLASKPAGGCNSNGNTNNTPRIANHDTVSISGLPDWCKNGYGLWLQDSTNQVFVASRPATWPTEPSVSLSSAKGEYESFQIIVLPAPGRTLTNVRLSMSGLVKGTDKISASNIQWYQVGYVQQFCRH